MKMELRRRALDKIYKRRDRIDIPEFQREEVWPTEKKRLLIDSILRGWHLPKFYFRKTGDTFECIDGQQRLQAIWQFYDNELELSEASAKQYRGSTYDKLPDLISDSFDDFEIEIEEIEDATDKELEELFLRLQLGTPLTTSEKLNAIGGDMHDFCRSAAKQPFFRSKIGVKDTRYAHFDIAVKWAFIEARGIQPQMRFAQLAEFLEQNRSFSTSSELAKRIKDALRYLDQAFLGGAARLRNRASVLSVCMVASALIRAKVAPTTARSLGKFLDDFLSRLTVEVEKGSKSTNVELLSYQAAISYGSTGGDSIRTRFDILSRRLVREYPEFFRLLEGVPRSRERLEEEIGRKAKTAAELIYTVNKKYAARSGEDCVKPTNEMTAAIAALGEPRREVDSLKEFVDGLYFIFYEGTGNCARLPQPPPEFVMELKALRTSFRHDVDHGEEKKVRSKRMRHGEICRKYSGKPSPQECSPNELLLTQDRLLEAAAEMLRRL